MKYLGCKKGQWYPLNYYNATKGKEKLSYREKNLKARARKKNEKKKIIVGHQ